MDILRLLQTSTKHERKPQSAANSAKGKLPSSGTAANPQLFHDAIPSRGTKRKRGGEKVELAPVDVEEETLDYFATKDSAPINKSSSRKQQPKHEQAGASTNGKLLDEEECRQILRSHRVKIMLLPSGEKVEEKKVKKSKKTKVAKKPSKDGARHLFPQPLMDFADLKTQYGIFGRMAQNLADQGYKIPTEVQMGSLPLLLQPEVALGESADELKSSDGTYKIDLLAVAPTGSGKTLAFLIPIVNQIIQRRRNSSDKDAHILEAIVIAPTKELASQIVNEGKKLSLGTGVKIVGMRKGLKLVEGDNSNDQESSSSEEEEDEEENTKPKTQEHTTRTDILVTTPGLLLNSLSTSDPSEHLPLPSVLTLVLDEADVLLDPLFRDQTLGIWSSCINPSLRTTLWSATMGSNIETLASTYISTRKTTLSLTTPSTLLRLVVGLKDSAIPNITHKLIYSATEPGKLIALRQLLHPTSQSNTSSLRPPFLVFTQTIPRAIALHSELLYDIPSEAGGSTRLAVLHSSLSDTVRSSIMTRFRNGEIWVLITTDILSRGVDFRGINGVVNYDVPTSSASYIHRVGRTGRAGRDGGVAVTLYTKEDIPHVKNVANVIWASEKAAGKSEEESEVKKWFLDALPKPTKDEKKKLKLLGVEVRRGGLTGKDGEKVRGKGQISTKSGYERKLENRKKGAIEGSRRRALLESVGHDQEEGDVDVDEEFTGFD